MAAFKSITYNKSHLQSCRECPMVKSTCNHKENISLPRIHITTPVYPKCL